MNNRNIYSIVVFLILMNSCIDPFKPNISKYENVFVVDGELTNLPGPYTVKLERSYKFNESSGTPVSGAIVKIIDNSGIEIALAESGKGVYVTTDNTFRGVIGNSYKLQIKLNGENYESGFETLKKPIPIDSVYWEYKSGEKFVHLYLDTHDPTNSTHFYSWELEETWKFRVPIDIDDKPEWKECFKNAIGYNFNIGTSTHRNGDIISMQPLQVIGENTNRLYIRYTMLARQFALTEQAYNYFRNLITLNQNQGTLFDPVPYSLLGNMKNLDNKGVPVLGYFLVAGASEQRIFIDRKDLPKEFSPTDGFNGCSSVNIAVPYALRDNVQQDPTADSLMRVGYTEIYRYISTPFIVSLTYAKPYCFNCTLSGTNKVPDFWKEMNTK
jgi:Domain of unknown function (DUF4249)